jgi:hypothetical protein
MDLLLYMAPAAAWGNPAAATRVFECFLDFTDRSRLLFARDADETVWLDYVEILVPATIALPVPNWDQRCRAKEEALVPASASPDTAEWITVCWEQPRARGAPGDYRDIWIRLPDTVEVLGIEPGDLCWKYTRYLRGQEGASIPIVCKMESGAP